MRLDDYHYSYYGMQFTQVCYSGIFLLPLISGLQHHFLNTAFLNVLGYIVFSLTAVSAITSIALYAINFLMDRSDSTQNYAGQEYASILFNMMALLVCFSSSTYYIIFGPFIAVKKEMLVAFLFSYPCISLISSIINLFIRRKPPPLLDPPCLRESYILWGIDALSKGFQVASFWALSTTLYTNKGNMIGSLLPWKSHIIVTLLLCFSIITPCLAIVKHRQEKPLFQSTCNRLCSC